MTSQSVSIKKLSRAKNDWVVELESSDYPAPWWRRHRIIYAEDRSPRAYRPFAIYQLRHLSSAPAHTGRPEIYQNHLAL